jgi:4-aminobutyrate aminotransferase-like enzyme
MGKVELRAHQFLQNGAGSLRSTDFEEREALNVNMVRLNKYRDRIEQTPPLVVGEHQIGEIVDKVERMIKAVA